MIKNKEYENTEQAIEVVVKVVDPVEKLHIFFLKDQNELIIHKISSWASFEPQFIMDALLDEITLYDHYGFDKSDKERIVRFYGLDYYDTGMDADVLDNRILSTPFNWDAASENHIISSTDTVESHPIDLNDTFINIIRNGEGHQVEFKPSLRYNFNFNSNKDPRLALYHTAKTIAAFLNSDGGILIIGVNDTGEINGLQKDFSMFPEKHKDKFNLTFDSLFFQFLKPSLKPFITTYFHEIDNIEVFIVFVRKSTRPVFLRNKIEEKEEKEFFIRLEASSNRLFDVEEIIDYIFNNWIQDRNKQIEPEN